MLRDTQIRSSSARDWFSTTRPYVPSAVVAGEVNLVGEGEDLELVARRVAARTAEGGGYSERAALPLELAADAHSAIGTRDVIGKTVLVI